MVKRKKYSSFTFYFKKLIEHSDINIGTWEPNVSTFFNSSTSAIIKWTSKILALSKLTELCLPQFLSWSLPFPSCPKQPNPSSFKLFTWFQNINGFYKTQYKQAEHPTQTALKFIIRQHASPTIRGTVRSPPRCSFNSSKTQWWNQS